MNQNWKISNQIWSYRHRSLLCLISHRRAEKRVNGVTVGGCAQTKERLLIFASWWSEKLLSLWPQRQMERRTGSFAPAPTNWREANDNTKTKSSPEVKPSLGDGDSGWEQCTSLNTQRKPCGFHWLLVSSVAWALSHVVSPEGREMSMSLKQGWLLLLLFFFLFLHLLILAGDLNVAWLEWIKWVRESVAEI